MARIGIGIKRAQKGTVNFAGKHYFVLTTRK